MQNTVQKIILNHFKLKSCQKAVTSVVSNIRILTKYALFRGNIDFVCPYLSWDNRLINTFYIPIEMVPLTSGSAVSDLLIKD